MYVCTYVCMFVCMYVCMYVYIIYISFMHISVLDNLDKTLIIHKLVQMHVTQQHDYKVNITLLITRLHCTYRRMYSY